MATKMHFYPLEIFVVLISLISLAAGGLTDSKEEASSSSFAPEYLKPPESVKLSKFSLTQKGYIQFLRYITPVPPIGDFTFCIWMRSANLTYSHPLLSYSKHEEERLIRAWVTPGGEEIRLALREIDIIKVPVHLKENQWYHICQSWSTKTGHWDLFLNGKLKSHGYNAKARGQILSKDGDIVVGQEYTDFDKGLDDGIEGDVFGFNLVLASTTAPPKSQRHQKEPTAYSNRRVSVAVSEKIKGHYIVASGPLYLRRVSKSLENSEVTPTGNNSTNITSNNDRSDKISKDETSESLSRNKRQSYFFPSPYVRAIPEVREKIIIRQYNPYYYPVNNHYGQSYQYAQFSNPVRPTIPIRNQNSRISNDIPYHATKPLGLQLVELSFRCDLGRGAPLKGRDVLISWTKSPVRVFGGAILKKVDPFCY